MGLIGRFVFGNFHHEPLGLDEEIEWDAPDSFSGREPGYYAAREMRAACSDLRLSRTSSDVASCGDQVFFWPRIRSKRGVPGAAVVSGKIVAFPQPDRLALSRFPACITNVGGIGAKRSLATPHPGARDTQLTDEKEFCCGLAAHSQQQAAIGKSVDIRGTVSPLPVSNRDVGDLQTELRGAKQKSKSPNGSSAPKYVRPAATSRYALRHRTLVPHKLSLIGWPMSLLKSSAKNLFPQRFRKRIARRSMV